MYWRCLPLCVIFALRMRARNSAASAFKPLMFRTATRSDVRSSSLAARSSGPSRPLHFAVVVRPASLKNGKNLTLINKMTKQEVAGRKGGEYFCADKMNGENPALLRSP